MLSIVTGSLNRPDSLRCLIDSIDACTNIPWELIVSDASDEPYPFQVDGNVKILPERPRLGCVKGYNRAFAHAKGEYVIWLNDDTTVRPGYAEAAVTFMDQHPGIGLGALYYAEGKLPYKVNLYWGMVYANFGIIRRQLGNAVGWFDTALTMYGCDNSLAFRVLLSGHGIGTIPGARVWHYPEPDAGKRENQKHRIPDTWTLKRRYGHKIKRMKNVYDKTKHLAGPLVIGE